MSTLTDRLEFAIVLARETWPSLGGQKEASSFTVATLASALMSAERHLHRLAEASCNGFRTTADKLASDRATACTQKAVTAMLAPYGITPRFEGDPRGVMITLTLPRTKRTNGWSGEGYCVPR